MYPRLTLRGRRYPVSAALVLELDLWVQLEGLSPAQNSSLAPNSVLARGTPSSVLSVPALFHGDSDQLVL